MALFTVNRYLGDDESEEEEEEEKVDVLAKLKAVALKRKAEREAEGKKAKKTKKENASASVADSQNKRMKKKNEEAVTNTAVEKSDVTSVDGKNVADDDDDKSEVPTIDASSTEVIRTTEEEPSPRPDEEAEPFGEIGGFTLLTATDKKEKPVVDRVLPEWLSKPSIIAVNLDEDESLIADDSSIDERLKGSLNESGIRHFFPVQRRLIPFLLSSLRAQTLYMEPGFLRPNDVCVSAPTGSGKTLAFVVPLLQALSHRVVVHVRALVVLPVKDLALQVYKVFATHAASLGLKVGLAVAGHHQSFRKERDSLVTKGKLGFYSKVDILVATPGRLVDHMRKTPGFSLRQLRFLVIDEADRMMEDFKQDWLDMVEEYALEGRRKADPRRSLCLGGAADEPPRLVYPLQKLLFSATLSQNPEKLELMKLFQPKLFTSILPPPKGGHENDDDVENFGLRHGQFIGKYTTPTGLTEYSCFVKNPSTKPLIILYFVAHLKFKRVLVFANTKENARRLLHLTRGFDGGISAKEFSSNLTSEKRERILKQFDREKVDMIICTDAMARGMDVPGVKWVISYDCPIYVKTYIHRVGRTARAGKPGSAITLLEENQLEHFDGMMKEAGKPSAKMHKIRADENELRPYFGKYQEALEYLKAETELKNEKLNESKRKRTSSQTSLNNDSVE